MRDIIFISFEFPPLNVGGVFRSIKFVKYFPENGIKPTVYSLLPEDYSKVYEKFNVDETLLRDIEGRDYVARHIPIDSVWTLYNNRLKKFFSIYFNNFRGNEYKKWKTHLLSQVKRDAQTTEFKAVLVTAPPFGMLKLAKEIADILKLPLIIDMRDAWAYWNISGFGSYFHYRDTLLKEKKYFKAAAKVIATSEQTITDWLELHPELSKNKFECVTNGYDVDGIEWHSIQLPAVAKGTEFKIVYVGSFYFSPEARARMLKPFYRKKPLQALQFYPRKQDWLYRSPYFFLKTLARVFELQPSLKTKVKVVFAGNQQGWLTDMISKFDLKDQVKELGFISHKESMDLQSRADALLITSAKVPRGRDCFIAGKTFEYITMGKPILAFVADGAQKDILKDTGMAVFFDPDQIEDSANMLIDLVMRGKELSVNENYLRSFHRKKLTAKMATVIHKVIDNCS